MNRIETQLDRPAIGRVEEQRKRLILQAAADCVLEDGVANLTLRKVARRANVTTGMITYYFENKDELLLATLDETALRLRERLGGASDGLEGRERVRRIFEFALTPRDEGQVNWPFWLECAATAASRPELRRYHAGRMVNARVDQANIARQMIAAEQLSPDVDPDLFADLIVAVFQGLGVDVTLDEERMPPERAMRICDFLLDALASWRR